MNKRKLLYAWMILSIPGSFISFYATNLILSDIANMFYMTITKDFISSLPIFMIAAEFVAASICLLNIGVYPDDRQHLLRLNAGIIAVFSLLGVISAILSGVIIYGSFVAPYPFPGATVLTLIFNAAVFAASLLTVKKCCGAPPRNERISKRLGRGMRWIVMVIFIYYAFDRFGAVLWMPVYVQPRTFNKTFVFYLSLLLPVCLLLQHYRCKLGLYKNKNQAGIVYSIAYFIADAILCAAVLILGINNTEFVAAISPALGIERLLNKPVVTIVHFCLISVLILSSLGIAVFRAVRHRKSLRAFEKQDSK